jgi:hypothetical protein
MLGSDETIIPPDELLKNDPGKAAPDEVPAMPEAGAPDASNFWDNLPSPDKLGPDWKDTTNPKNQTGNYRQFENSKTGDKIEFDKGQPGKPGWRGQDHYHRFNPKSTGDNDKYLDSKGNPVPKGSEASHLPVKPQPSLLNKIFNFLFGPLPKPARPAIPEET